jgi:hypothetical protein
MNKQRIKTAIKAFSIHLGEKDIEKILCIEFMKQSHRSILFLFHQCFIWSALVFIATEVQQPMGHDTLQFILESRLVGQGVFFYPVNADEDITGDFLAGLWRIAEGDDVCIGIVIEVLLVDVQEKIIGTEDVIQSRDFLLFPLGYLLQPLTGECSFGKGETDFFKEEENGLFAHAGLTKIENHF